MKLLLLFLTCTSIVLSTVGVNSFVKILGGDNDECLESIDVTLDGGYIGVGYSESFAPGRGVFLSKFFPNGSVEFATRIGGSFVDHGKSVKQTKEDGGYIVTGFTKSFGTLINEDLLLMKFFSNGSIEWMSVVVGDPSGNTRGNCVQQTNDGGYIVCGETESFGATEFDLFLAKFSSNGTEVEWFTRLESGGTDEVASSVYQTSDSGYIVTGSSDSSKILLVKFFSNGSTDFLRTFAGGDFNEEGTSVKETSGGGYVVTGYSNSFSGNVDIIILYFRPNGSLEWARSTGGSGDDRGYDVIESTSDDSSFVIFGESTSFGEFSYPLIIKYDSEGNLTGASVYDGIDDSGLRSGFQTIDERYIVAGNYFYNFQNYGFLSLVDDTMYNCEWLNNVTSSLTNINIADLFVEELVTWYEFVDVVNVQANQSWTANVINFPIVGVESTICTSFKCFGFGVNESGVCENRGECVKYDLCDCIENYEDYMGEPCVAKSCFGVLINDTENNICGGNGECVSFDQCMCFTNYSNPLNGGNSSDTVCTEFDCFGIYKNDMGVCNNHGTCVKHDYCECSNPLDYSGRNCEIWDCYGKKTNETFGVCEDHGECLDVDYCECSEKWLGDECEILTCFNISEMDRNSCGEFGVCKDLDVCECISDDYTSSSISSPCDTWYCYGIHVGVTSSVCSGMGSCLAKDTCECRDEYEGDDCETWSCGTDYKLETTCSGKGNCIGPNQCECDYGYKGELCGENLIYANIIAPIASVLGSLFMIAICALTGCIVLVCCTAGFLICMCGGILFCSSSTVLLLRRRVGKFKRLKHFDQLLKEQQLEEDDTIAHLNFKKELFLIDMHDINRISILGEGGSQSVVYKSEWGGKIVAFKCFKTKTVTSTQDNFDEFEKEVQLLSSLSHPNIIRFFGACLNPPRVGIVMEFCSKGEILEFIMKFRLVRGTEYPVPQKLRMLTEVASALEFIHSKNVIHRDLKSENVLISEDEVTKLMDFGLSKIVERVSQLKTKRIGTSDYMAPEIINSGNYTEKVDVFSFAILIFVVLAEMKRPYSDPTEDEERYVTPVELKVANDRNYRPNIEKHLKSRLENENLMWVSELMVRCWDHDPNERYNIKEIREMMQKRRLTSLIETENKVESLNQNKKIEEVKVEEELNVVPKFLNEKMYEDEEEISEREDENISFEELMRKYLEMKKENSLLRKQLKAGEFMERD